MYTAGATLNITLNDDILTFKVTLNDDILTFKVIELSKGDFHRTLTSDVLPALSAVVGWGEQVTVKFRRGQDGYHAHVAGEEEGGLRGHSGGGPALPACRFAHVVGPVRGFRELLSPSSLT